MFKFHSIPVRSMLGGATFGALAMQSASAGELSIKLQLPEIDTPQYQRPYVAIWIEKADDTFVSTLSLWHMIKDKRGGELTRGDRYLSDLRNWWKQSGTTSQMPIDGLSSATRAPGEHQLVFTEGKAPLTALPAGQYQLVMEVARELKGPRPPGAAFGAPPGERPPRPEGESPREGGPPMGVGPRGPSKDALESLRLNFIWPVKKETIVKATGKVELGAVSLVLKP